MKKRLPITSALRARRFTLRRVAALTVTLVACSLLALVTGPGLMWPLFLFPLMLGAVFFFEPGVLIVTTWVAVLAAATQAPGPAAPSWLPFREAMIGVVLCLTAGLFLARILRRGQDIQATLATSTLTDRLTGLYNYGTFADHLRREVRRVDRYRGEVSLIMLDLDHFKEFNDTYGHEAGNDLLSRVGTTLLAHVRESDMAARYGGEEFAVLIRGDEAHGYELAQRLRRAIENVAIEVGDGLLVGTSVSAGVSTYPGGAVDAGELVELADAALYESKRRGRNRVTIHTGSSTPAVAAALSA